MRSPLIDVRHDEELSAALSQVLLFIEQVNANACLEVRQQLERKLRDRPANTEDLISSLAHVDLDLKNIVLQTLKWLVCGGRWAKRSVLLALAHELELQPTIDRAVLEAVVDLLMRPARLVSVEGPNWRIEGSINSLPHPAAIDVLYEKLWLYDRNRRPLLATRPLLNRPSTQSPELPLFYWEEPFDPIGIVRLFISEVLGEAGRAADHYLQRWLRTTFHLTQYDKYHKYALAAVCERFNTLFYDASVPSMRIVHNQRAATASVSLLLLELAEVMRQGDQRANHPPRSDAYYERQSFGFYLFLHFCRLVRRRTLWPDLERAREHEATPETLHALSSIDGEQCVSSLRPVGYTYFQARIYGVISSLPGLSNVFRGGLLPRTDSGRAIALLGAAGIGKTVLALQALADFSRFGGLGIYVSFEESYDSILDRLVTFGLWDRSRFVVKQAGGDLREVVEEIHRGEPGLGLLIFYQPGKGASSTLPEVIDTIGKATAAWVGQKALVIDNVNSLHTPLRAGEALPDSRGYIYEAIAAIDRSTFFGILLAEKGGRFYRNLPYLTDTVIELGFDEEAHTRWFEIKKCRVQDYHEGKHPFRMLDGRGVVIYPSLASRRSSLRGKIRSTLSQRRVLPLLGSTNFEGIPEKSSTLIWGPQGAGKTLVALKFLTVASILKPGKQSRHRSGSQLPQNVMAISFRTSEKNFEQALQRQTEVAANWGRIPQKWLRWYSPGSNLTAEQIISEIWKYFNDSRRRGIPVDRIMFDETEVAQDMLPALRRDSLFWPTILELTSTEAATSFFICGASSDESSVIKILRGSMDNALHVFEDVNRDGERTRCVDLVQHTELVPGRKRILEERETRTAKATPGGGEPAQDGGVPAPSAPGETRSI